MNSGFFIMELWQTGNIGSHNIREIKENPKEGFKSHDEAKTVMLDLHKSGNWTLTKSNHKFTVMELFWSF